PPTALCAGTYYVSQTSAQGCERARTTVSVTINTTPGAPLSPCTPLFRSADSPTVSNLAATGTSVKWYSAATGGTALATTTSLSTGTYYVSQTSAQGCESGRTTVNVTMNTTPSAPSAASPQNFCSADYPTG